MDYRELDTVAPGALLSRQRRCSVDRWQSPGVRYGADILPATGNAQCAAGPPWRTGPWPSLVASAGTGCTGCGPVLVEQEEEEDDDDDEGSETDESEEEDNLSDIEDHNDDDAHSAADDDNENKEEEDEDVLSSETRESPPKKRVRFSDAVDVEKPKVTVSSGLYYCLLCTY